jgi:hypothetical protein
MIKVRRWSLLILALALLTTAAFLILDVLRPSEADNDSVFAEKVAGTYLVTRDPADGPSRILTIHSDGNLSSIQSIQFSEGAGPEGYDLSDGTFLGTTGAHYVLELSKDFQTLAGTVEGRIFAPGVDPLHPGEAAPIAQFTDEFTAQRVNP